MPLSFLQAGVGLRKTPLGICIRWIFFAKGLLRCCFLWCFCTSHWVGQLDAAWQTAVSTPPTEKSLYCNSHIRSYYILHDPSFKLPDLGCVCVVPPLWTGQGIESTDSGLRKRSFLNYKQASVYPAHIVFWTALTGCSRAGTGLLLCWKQQEAIGQLQRPFGDWAALAGANPACLVLLAWPHPGLKVVQDLAGDPG